MRARSCLAVSLVCYLNAELLLGQTSPKGTFRIETVERPAEDPTADRYEQQYVVSTADSKVREPLGEPRQAQPATYFISPDERWIFATIYFGSRMGGGELFKQEEGLKFQEVNKSQSFAEQAWRFFAKQEQLKPDDVLDLEAPATTGIIDFVAWGPDSARLLVDLRGGDFGGKRERRLDQWYVYFNTKRGKFELTDYLRRLNNHAWNRSDNFGEAASAEPLGEFPPEAESKKRSEAADRRVKESFQKLLDIHEKQVQESIRDEQTSAMQRQIYEEQLKSSGAAQRGWINTREIGAKFYAESGPKSTAERRYWQYMADSTEARASDIERQLGSNVK